MDLDHPVFHSRRIVKRIIKDQLESFKTVIIVIFQLVIFDDEDVFCAVIIFVDAGIPVDFELIPKSGDHRGGAASAGQRSIAIVRIVADSKSDEAIGANRDLIVFNTIKTEGEGQVNHIQIVVPIFVVITSGNAASGATQGRIDLNPIIFGAVGIKCVRIVIDEITIAIGPEGSVLAHHANLEIEDALLIEACIIGDFEFDGHLHPRDQGTIGKDFKALEILTIAACLDGADKGAAAGNLDHIIEGHNLGLQVRRAGYGAILQS